MRFIHDLVSHGAAPALLFPGRSPISCAELADRLASIPKGPTKRLIALEAQPTEQAIVAYLAALHAGDAVALLPPGDSAALQEFENTFQPQATLRAMGGRWRQHEEPGVAPGALHPDLAVLLGTSGSTGRCKHVRLSASAVEANANSIVAYLDLQPDDRAALVLPFHYSYGLSVLHSHLAAGASVFVADKGVLEPSFIDALREAGCTTLAGVPYTFELLERIGFRQRLAELPALRRMTVAGGRLAPDLVRAYRQALAAHGKRLFVMYGQTEATARIAYVPPERLEGREDCIGIAIPGGALRLLDERGRPVEGAGRVGELAYRGPNVMMGYAQTRADLARGAEVDELRTGDLAERTPDGLYRIVGRLKRIAKIAGLRIDLEGIEHALAARGIASAVAADDRRLAVVYEGGPGVDAVRRLAAAAAGLTPLHVAAVLVQALPRLSSGKLDYARVLALVWDDEDQPADPRAVLGVYREAFYPRRVAPADSFRSLDGDSLRYVQLSLALERTLGRIPEGWEDRSIASLAAAPAPRRPAAGVTLDVGLLLRAAAILLVVLHHATLWPIPGGAATMILLVGYGLARFQADALFTGDAKGVLRPLARNLALYYPLVVGYSLAWDEVLWPSFLLVGNLALTEPPHMLPYLYWFVEAYAQIVLLCLALFAVPAVRRAAAARPFHAGLAFLGVAVAARFVAPLVWDIGNLRIFTVPDMLYLAALGWCACFAATRGQRLLLLALAAAILPAMAYAGGNWTGAWVKFGLQLACIAALLFAPRVRVPRSVAALALPVAAASFHIYLFHRILPELLLPAPLPGALDLVAATAAIITGIAVGLGAFRLQQAAVAGMQRMRSRADEAPPARGAELAP